jgi:hypothetical protein
MKGKWEHTMTRLERIESYGSWIAAAAFVVFATMSGHAGAQATGIATTKHNLVGTSNANRVTAGTDEICVFCHTPHAANTTAGAPLWNKNLPSNTYTMYSSTTMDSPTGTVGAPSLVCLSCHDGTQAMDNIINTPGSGTSRDANGRALTTGGQNYTWAANGRVDPATGRLLDTAITNLGTDLSNDHPIGIAYCGGGLTGAGNVVSGTCADSDFKNQSNDVKTAAINGQQVFWVDTTVGTAGTRQRTDIQLYTRNSNQPFVECGSCHDPHVQQGVNNAGATFLRISNAGSSVCLACHVK